MRLADIVMSFPSLLLAVVVLYMLEPRVSNVVLVLAITRVPVYLRTMRAEVLEIRERMFVTGGAGDGREAPGASSAPCLAGGGADADHRGDARLRLHHAGGIRLSFLGLGIQPPEISWGLMVADGRNYLSSAWWLAFWPGLAIMLTTIALNLLSNWVRIATDPKQRWRLEEPGERRMSLAKCSRTPARGRGSGVEFDTRYGVVQAVARHRSISTRGEMLAILGESGSGKSVRRRRSWT